jgi:TetR/AcrR family transcriptional regulator, regulator of cefoperazone and chloramphenicol sensitivity
MTPEIEHPGPNSPRERILTAVIDCIEQDGIHNLTTRSIARLAGTNIASINYYFRSKDALVAEALQLSLDHMLADIQELLDDRQRPVQETMEEVFRYLIDGTVRFPGISMANLFSALVEKQYDSPGAQAVRQIFEWIIARLSEAYPQHDPAALRVVLYQLVSTILFTMLAPEFFQSALPIDFSSAQDRQAFVGYLSKTLQASLEAL